MRREFIINSKEVDSSGFIGRWICPWATKIVEVDGGYLAFESIDDYRTWEDQR